ncbi:MAG: sulfurtransferase-like selenium metabolism protein YedF [Syntrophobacteraceae bacterium]|nr:sulfurtransferase-like selenium metabolism protein YedF [Syntrophobacteraceae bacterium]
MSEQVVDCRGMSCPGPVLKAKEIIEGGSVASLCVLVDNRAARENVGRFLSRMGYKTEFEEEQGGFTVRATREESASACESLEGTENPDTRDKVAVVVGTDTMGKGDDTLGRKLIKNFIATLKEMAPELWRIILLNGGVKLAVEGAESLSELQSLERNGVTILVCGTCLDHFRILDKKQVGETTNMLDVVTAMQMADKVISVM